MRNSTKKMTIIALWIVNGKLNMTLELLTKGFHSFPLQPKLGKNSPKILKVENPKRKIKRYQLRHPQSLILFRPCRLPVSYGNQNRMFLSQFRAPYFFISEMTCRSLLAAVILKGVFLVVFAQISNFDLVIDF